MASQRDWQVPTEATTLEAQRLLDLLRIEWPAPDVHAQADGSLSLEWEQGAHGWLTLSVAGRHTVEHAGVIAGDEYGLVEDFGDVVPGWAQELLRRLHQAPARTLQ